ncbi:formyl-CoA transferase [Anaerotardibacter muris]|uniref:formyl-CoA transferase n=1 Tax=Anaerotardibacter muris TaxID=2941505 RepID=UPI00204086BF|nr:formyl-CoA transferase [Anaerotardibacter muris]
MATNSDTILKPADKPDTPAKLREDLAVPGEVATAPLDGVLVIDMTQVQSGPTCTQMLAWFGAEVIKIEKLTGDQTRGELRDIPGEDSLYFLQLNSNKKSLTLNLKTENGKKIMADLIKSADIFVENLHPGAIEELGFGWEDVHKMNPRVIMGSIKGFNPHSRFENLKCFETVAQSTGGNATVTGWNEGDYNVPTMAGASTGDANSGMHLLTGLMAALFQREKTGKGCYVYQSMQNAAMNLCRTKLHDQILLDKTGVLPEYPTYPDGKTGDTVPRQENSEGGGEISWIYKCKGWETDPNAYACVIVQWDEAGFEKFCHAIGFEDWLTDPKFSTSTERFNHKKEIRAAIEKFTMTKDKYEVAQILGDAGVPCGPVLSWKEIENDQELKDAKMIVEVDEGGKRGTYLTLGCPTFFSNYSPDITRAPKLGENNVEILTRLGYSSSEIDQLKTDNVIA